MKNQQSLADLSENAQMYLVEIARLCEVEKPVPLSHLAHELKISSSSANEMCRKLENQKLLRYQPYRGVTLTPEGEKLAYYLLRRHRLWEVFLVEQLGMSYQEAHAAACQLEHATSDVIADRLENFLGNPHVNPRGMPIPDGAGQYPDVEKAILASLTVGEYAHINQVSGDSTMRAFLARQGVRPGATVYVRGAADDSMLIAVDGEQVLLDIPAAERIIVETPINEKKGNQTDSYDPIN